MKIMDWIRAVALWPLVRPMAPREDWRGWSIRWLLFIGMFRVSTDRSGWTFDGKPYHFHQSARFWYLAFGNYNLGIARQLFRPNTQISHAPQTHEKQN